MKLKPKNRFSIHRLISTYLCGYHGRKLMENGPEVQRPDNWAMAKGRATEDAIKAYWMGIGDVSDELKAILPKPEEIAETDVEIKGEIPGWPVYGRADAQMIDGTIIEIKDGIHYKWHELQLKFYMYFGGSNKGILINTKNKEISKFDVFDVDRLLMYNVIKLILENYEKQETEKNSQCRYCTLRKKCKEWNEYNTPDEILDYIDDNNQLIKAENELSEFYKKHNKIIDEYFLYKESISDIKNVINKNKTNIYKFEPKNYHSHNGSITISKRKTKDLPDNFKETYSYVDYPELYKIEIKKKEAIKQFGIEKEIKVITFRKEK